MEPALMMKTACVLLAITALGGLAMAGMRLAGRVNPPTWIAMLHGFLAGAAVTLLLYAWFTVGLPTAASWALLLFLVAALGGIVLNLNYHWKQVPLPIGLMVGHAVIAVAGFVLLVIAILRG
jgi:glucose uptake protein GlcU